MGFDLDSKTQMHFQASRGGFNLYPTTPNQTHRYSKSERPRLLPQHVTIRACLPSQRRKFESEPEPEGWKMHVQAEGQAYFLEPEKRCITEANVRRPETCKRVSYFMRCLEKKAEALQTPITQSMEILIQLDPNDEESCGYYVVDHESRLIFWLDDVSSEQVDVPIPPVSESHLQWGLKELYAMHLEFFSAHLPGIDMPWVRELKGILGQARADHLTSSVGTFPYGADLCKEFLELLRDHASPSTELLSDPYTIWIVARLWSQVARNRYLNYYGEENARLSRDQYITTRAPSAGPFILTLISNIALFGVPKTYAKELNLLWVDRVVYVDPWKSFFAKTLREWKGFAAWLTAFTFIHAFFYFMTSLPRALPLASFTLTVVGLAISILLVNLHSMSSTFETDDAAAYLGSFFEPAHGFALLGCAFSLPKVTLYWTMLLAVGEGVFCTSSALHIQPMWTAGVLAGIATFALFLKAVFHLRKFIDGTIALRGEDSISEPSFEGRV